MDSFPKVLTYLEKIRVRCSRVTGEGRKFLPEIDGLRFLAIALVIGYHLHDHLTQRHPALLGWRDNRGIGYQLFQTGHLGVQLFFILSGFILALPFAQSAFRDRPAISISNYFLRRITRLEPPYLINLFLFFILLVVARGDSGFDLLGPLFASATYTHGFIYGEMSRINFVAWSLEIEAQFYLIAPALAYLYALRESNLRYAAYLGLAVFSFLMHQLLLKYGGPHLSRTIAGSLPFFMAGWSIADRYVNCWESQPSRTPLAFDILFLCTITLLFSPYHHMPLVNCAVLALLVVAALRGRIANAFFRLPWIVTIGGMCYTIYLYHFMIITILAKFTKHIAVGSSYAINMAIQSAILIPLVIGCCMLLFIAFEKPFMEIARRVKSTRIGQATK